MAKEVFSDKLMVLGVDGLDPRLCKKYMSEGRMPNFKKLIERGAQREDLVLLGAQPTVTPPQWTTLATGAYPSTHSITQFNRMNQGMITQQGYNLDSRNCKAEPAWNCLAEAGRKTLVFHWPGSSWPPTSDSENLYVIDGCAPGSVGSSTMQSDGEVFLQADATFTEVSYQIRGSQDAVAPCVIKREEAAPKATDDSDGQLEMAVIMRQMSKMTPDVMQQMDAAGVETIYVMTEDVEGYGIRGNGPQLPMITALSPIKDASGWDNAPADAKEFTLLLSKGAVRRVGLILKNEEGIYDRVAVYRSKKDNTPLVTCYKDKMVYDVIDDTYFMDERLVASRHYKLVELAEDASKMRMYVSAAMEVENDSVVHPKRIHKAIVENVGPFPPQANIYAQSEETQLLNIEVWDHVVDWYIKSFDYFIENEEIEYIFSHLHSVDLIEHTFIRYMKDKNFNELPEEEYARWMERLYDQTDRYIGGMLHYLDEGWAIIVTSDHAQVSATYMPPGIGDMNGVNTDLMCELGYTVLEKDENGNDLKKIDWSKTRAIAAQGNDIFINLKGREKNGIVEPEDQYELEEQIISDLYSYRHPISNKRVIALALRNREAILLGYGGPTAGDICFWIAEGYNYDHTDGLSTSLGEADTSLSPIFIAAGKGFKEGFTTDRVIRQVDVAPTICHLAGVKMPAQSEGSIVHQILDSEF